MVAVSKTLTFQVVQILGHITLFIYSMALGEGDLCSIDLLKEDLAQRTLAGLKGGCPANVIFAI